MSKQIRMSIQSYAYFEELQRWNYELDLLRSRHVLLGMILGCVLSPPSLPLSFPVNGPSNGSKTGHNSRSGRGAAAPTGRPHQSWGGRAKVAAPPSRSWGGRARVGAAAPTGRPRQSGSPDIQPLRVRIFLLEHPIASPFLFNESYDSPLRSPSKKPTQHNTKTYQKHQKLEAIPSI